MLCRQALILVLFLAFVSSEAEYESTHAALSDIALPLVRDDEASVTSLNDDASVPSLKDDGSVPSLKDDGSVPSIGEEEGRLAYFLIAICSGKRYRLSIKLFYRLLVRLKQQSCLFKALLIFKNKIAS